MSHFTDFHADDYGLFRKESERILECCEQGALTGVSVMTTSPVVSECMEMLMERPHTVLSVQQMMDHVWGWDSEAEINVVWVNISFLRKKIAELGAHVEIRATRGVGYSLEPRDD